MNRVSFFILAAVAAASLLGCGKGNFSERESEGKSGTFRYPITSEITTLDPAKVQDGDTIDALQQVFEGLVKWDENSKVVPDIAESWKISPDGKTYTFALRKGVKFHNRRAVSAQDFKYTMEREADPKFLSETAPGYMAQIDGFNDRWANKAQEIRGVKVVDDSHLAITTTTPCPYFLGLLTYPNYWVVCKEALDNGKEITSVAQMIGTGPFKADSYQPGQLLVLTANKDYWSGAPKIAKIERPIMKDPITRLNAFRMHELDLTPVGRQDIAGLSSDAQFKDQLHYFPRPALYYIGMNCKTYVPFRDRRVRRAFAMAIDSQKIVDTLLGGDSPESKCDVAKSILPPSVLGYRTNAAYIPFNLTAAKQLLAEAGYPNGKGMPPLTMYHRDGQTDVQRVAEAVSTQLSENLGVECSTKMLPWGEYLDKHNNHQLELFHMRWAADYLDPQDFLSLLLSTTGSENRIDYSNPQYDALCAKADMMVGHDEERLKLYAQAEDIVLQDAPFVPIYFEKDVELISPRVHGLRESVFGHLPHTTVSLE